MRNLEEDLEKLNASPLAGVGIEDNALRGSAVLRRRLRVEHLKRVPTTQRARNHSLNIVFIDRWRRWRSFYVFPRGRRLKSLRRSGRNQRNYQNI